MRERNCNYLLLLNGDQVAKKYAVSGLPTLYVIGADGKIAFSEAGFNVESYDKLFQMVENTLSTIPGSVKR